MKTKEILITTSPRYTLNEFDGKKILKGLGIAIGGAILTYLVTLLPTLDLGQHGVFLYPVLSALLNAGIKFFDGQSTK